MAQLWSLSVPPVTVVQITLYRSRPRLDSISDSHLCGFTIPNLIHKLVPIFPMTMTTCSHTRTAAALTEEAGAVNELHLSAAQKALSNCRKPLASISQFQSFTARNPTAPLTLRQDAASQSLRGSADLGHHESVSGDRFPYHRKPARCHAQNRFGTVNMEDNVNIKQS